MSGQQISFSVVLHVSWEPLGYNLWNLEFCYEICGCECIMYKKCAGICVYTEIMYKFIAWMMSETESSHPRLMREGYMLRMLNK